MYKYHAKIQLRSSNRSWDSNWAPWGGQQWPPWGVRGVGSTWKKNWNNMYKYHAKIQLRSSNRNWDSNLTPLGGQQWPTLGGNYDPCGGQVWLGQPEKKIEMIFPNHILNFKFLAQTEAEMVIWLPKGGAMTPLWAATTPLWGKGVGSSWKKIWKNMYKYHAKIQLRCSNRSWDSDLTPLGGSNDLPKGGSYDPCGGQGGTVGWNAK